MTKRKSCKVWRVKIDLESPRATMTLTTKQAQALIAAHDAIRNFGDNNTSLGIMGPFIIESFVSKEDLEPACRKVRKILETVSKKTGIDFSSPQVLEPELWSSPVQPCPKCGTSGFIAPGHRVKS